MKSKTHIKYGSYLLLLLYVFVNSPLTLFHDHHDEVVAYEEADSCEKVVYYGEISEDCHHKEHVSKSIKDCFLCDIHMPSNYEPTTFDYEFIKPEVETEALLFIEHTLTPFFHHTFSRGPPARV